MIRIYQIDMGIDENSEDFNYLMKRKFRDIPDTENKISLKKDKYKLVYEKKNEGEMLDDLFRIFNLYRPSDFKGHSLSVSDVVEIDGNFYRCQSIGWKKVDIVEKTVMTPVKYPLDFESWKSGTDISKKVVQEWIDNVVGKLNSDFSRDSFSIKGGNTLVIGVRYAREIHIFVTKDYEEYDIY